MRRVPKALLAVVLVALLAGLIYAVYRQYWTTPAPTRVGGPGRAGFAGPIPVVAAAASPGDMDVVMNSLGTATPLRTVTVRSRVDGELVRVYFREGQRVRQGELLAEIDPRPFQVQLEQAQGQLKRDEALLANAQLDLERYKTLFAQDSIAKQQVDTQASLVRQYEGALQMDRSQVQNARLQLAYTRISAPVGGRLGLRLVDPGNIVHAADQNGLVVITQLEPISVLYTVPQDAVPAVMKRLGAGEQIPVAAWDREMKARLAQGALASADNQVDPATGTVKLRAQFANEDGALFPNQFVNVRMTLDTLHDVIVIPAAAVQRGAQGLFVYVVGADNTVTQRPVKLGPSDGQRVSVSEGLVAGELVVTDGMDRLRPGASVQTSAQRPEIKPPPGKGRGKGDKSGRLRKKAE
ncbi:MAG TPA: MdtA/MuxA family multidrug efflux RND transporter periplasmic adaptor subunit [Burkholderiales bacterium]|jgi:multidrug efflux system membrane fusion protein|nr:MdtA/MuxA family multidrug efflux RND transporter periplasmic adaptor subunit [Burkholderiales bacterium]